MTENGKLLRAFAQTVQADSVQIAQRLKAPPEEPDKIKIGTIVTTGESLVPLMVAEYLRRYPNKKSVCTWMRLMLFGTVKNGRIQFCITDIHCPQETYERKELLKGNYMHLFPKCPLAQRTVDFAT